MTRNVLMTGLLLAAAVLGVLLFPTSGGEAPLGPPPGVGSVGVGGGGAEPDPGAPPAESVTLVVEVVARARLVPDVLAAAPCRLVDEQEEIPSEVRVLAGPRRTAPVDGPHLVRFDADFGRFCRFVTLDAGDAVVDVVVEGSASIRGRVVDEDRVPIEGARVWAGLLDEGGEPLEIVVGEDGSFEFPAVPAGPGVPLLARAEGRASRFRLVRPEWPALEGVELVLEPARRVDVVFQSRAPELNRGRVLLLPRDADVATLHYPFFLAAFPSQATWLAPDGTAAVEDLPASGAFAVMVDHPDVLSGARVAVPSRSRGQLRVVVAPTADEVAWLSGRVLDGNGDPLAGAELRLRGDAGIVEPGAVLAGPGHDPAPTSRTTSAGDGSYRLAVPARRSRPMAVEVRLHGRPGIVQELGTGRGLRHDFVLPTPQLFGGTPSVSIRLAARGRTVNANLAGAATIVRTDEEPFRIELAEPAMVDVDVQVRHADGTVTRLSVDDLAVPGPVEFTLDG
ncbi:MAG: carboxypeptidase-like regulatory domain-containing protein [Planctomycetota bacterium]|nr:carboxypeptidase-like regulatory domain-containing protein [Planctomycetota bacterium]MDA0932086.1 carboxypeptidase-like regulatory domain-containing protein [Planctomycetota bacterium]